MMDPYATNRPLPEAMPRAMWKGPYARNAIINAAVTIPYPSNMSVVSHGDAMAIAINRTAERMSVSEVTR